MESLMTMRFKRLAEAAFVALGLLGLSQAANAQSYELVLDERMVNITGRDRPAMLINGQLPGPVLRFKEGEQATIKVTNKLKDIASVHWHGILLPSSQDGVPGVSDGFQGIPPGQTFTYNFPIKQAGTYWYHSHSATQEQSGVYGPIIIEPKNREPFRYDRDYVIMLSDWTDENPEGIVRNLKAYPGYYNYNKRTLVDLFSEAKDKGLVAALKDRWMWGKMRMDPTDIADVSGYTFLINGQSAAKNFTALFKPGERVRLRFINGAAMSYFDVRIPGLKMTVVQADGNNVQPVPVDEFRIAVAETYDVIVQPKEEKAYSVLAESMDRTGFARATLSPHEGMVGEIPPHRPRPILTMADMGMSFGPTGLDRGTPMPETDSPGHVAPMDMDHGSMAGMAMPMNQPASQDSMQGMDHSSMPGMDHMNMPGMKQSAGSSAVPAATPSDMQGMKHSQMQGMDHSNMPGMNQGSGPPTPGRTQAPSAGGQPSAPANAMDHTAMGHGAPPSPSGAPMGGMDHSAMGHSMPMADPLANDTGAPPGAKVLSYKDLKAMASPHDAREPDRIIEIRLTGNMERFFWSINGRKFSEAQPIVLQYGERVRFRFINETMMNHPMHLHGMWMLPRVGNGAQDPVKHVVNIKPGTTLDVDIPADAEGGWAFHCHLLYHMEAGMMRKVIVERQNASIQ
jgi:CopA family copper-resistance protein